MHPGLHSTATITVIMIEARQDTTGEATPVKHGRNWKGGRIKTGDGYISVWKPDHPNATLLGYVAEHRIVMEKHLGRLLLKTEVVHHINEDKTDNRIENLQLFESNAKHMRLHKKFRKCKECGAPHSARGFCANCYSKKWRPSHPKRFCVECGKGLQHRGILKNKAGLCLKCWLESKRRKITPRKECGGPHCAKGLCENCYARQRRKLKKAEMGQAHTQAP